MPDKVKLTKNEESKLHGWYTELWNGPMHVSSEPGWVLTYAIVKLFGAATVKKAVKSLPNYR